MSFLAEGGVFAKSEHQQRLTGVAANRAYKPTQAKTACYLTQPPQSKAVITHTCTLHHALGDSHKWEAIPFLKSSQNVKRLRGCERLRKPEVPASSDQPGLRPLQGSP